MKHYSLITIFIFALLIHNSKAQQLEVYIPCISLSDYQNSKQYKQVSMKKFIKIHQYYNIYSRIEGESFVADTQFNNITYLYFVTKRAYLCPNDNIPMRYFCVYEISNDGVKQIYNNSKIDEPVAFDFLQKLGLGFIADTYCPDTDALKLGFRTKRATYIFNAQTKEILNAFIESTEDKQSSSSAVMNLNHAFNEVAIDTEQSTNRHQTTSQSSIINLDEDSSEEEIATHDRNIKVIYSRKAFYLYAAIVTLYLVYKYDLTKKNNQTIRTTVQA